MKQRASLPILTANGRSFSNTPLGRSVSINSSLTSFRSGFNNNSPTNVIFPSNQPLKKIKSEPWQRLFEGKKQQNQIVNKNKFNSEPLINEDIVNEQSGLEEISNTSFLPTAVQSHIDHLHEQVDNLTAQLSEERFKHKQTRINANDKYVNQLKTQETHFQELLQKKTIEYQNQLNEQEQKHIQFIDEQRIANLQREEQLKQKFEFLKRAFHVYKINSDKGNIEQIQMKINEVVAVLKEETSETDKQAEERIKQILIKERNLMNERQRVEIENIKKQYQIEIDQLQKFLSNANQDKKRSETLTDELAAVKIELRLSKEMAMNLTSQMKDLETQHAKSIRELNDYRARFNEKIHEFEKIRSEHVDN